MQCKTRDYGQVFVSYVGEYAGWRSYLLPSVPPFIAPCQRCGSSNTNKREELSRICGPMPQPRISDSEIGPESYFSCPDGGHVSKSSKLKFSVSSARRVALLLQLPVMFAGMPSGHDSQRPVGAVDRLRRSR